MTTINLRELYPWYTEDMLHFRSLMNDYHLKDLSNKVKSVLHAKMRSGQYIAAYAPYGYRKSEEDRHRLVIDEEAAAVVRRMFELRRGGMAYGKIAAVLNSEGILSPRWYWAKLYGNGSCKYANLWMYATVKNILTNEVYTGNLIQNQTGSRSYKDSTMICKPESEWIRHEEAHEAIISPEVWNEVQAINRERTRLSADNAPPKPFLFTGKLICTDCKAPLQGNRETQRRKNGTSKKYVSYFCSRYTASGYGACSRHTIYEMTLTELVLSEIRAHAEALELDEAAMLDRLQAQRTAADAERQESVRQEIGKLRRRVYELEQMTAKLYEDKVCGSISAASFAVLLEKTEQERRQRTDRLDTLLAEVREYEQSAADIQTQLAETFDQAQGNGGFALAEGGRGDGGDFDELAVGLILQTLHDLDEVDLRGLAVGDDLLGQQAELFPEVVDGGKILLRLFCDLPILVDRRVERDAAGLRVYVLAVFEFDCHECILLAGAGP